MSETTEVAAGTNTSWTSYPKVWNMGHPSARDIMGDDAVIVQEKVDGSQFSFGKFRDKTTGELYLRIKSKGALIYPEAPPQMFARAVAAVQARFDLLHEGWTYRGEVLDRPKHNVLAYDRTPKDHFILFDIAIGYEEYAAYDVVAEEAARIGFEVVPLLHVGKLDSAEAVRKLLETQSVLGGQLVEGVVVKNYGRFGIDGKPLMAKYVSEAFREVATGEWRAMNPSRGDIIADIAAELRTPARWQKAVQHLRERGELTDSPKDIGALIKEVVADVKNEEEAVIKERLFKFAWKVIGRTVTHGLPEWYKERLLEQQFNTPETEHEKAVPTEMTIK